MNETCDRCGPAVAAAYRADRDGELYLCGHCANRHWQALTARGWTFWPLAQRPVGRPVVDGHYVPAHGVGLDEHRTCVAGSDRRPGWRRRRFLARWPRQ
jgi:ribosomal protein S27AE